MRFPGPKRFFLAVFAVFMAFGGLFACLPDPRDRRSDPGEGPTPIPTPVAVSKPTYAVARGIVVYEQVLNGRIVPVIDAGLSFKTGGTVEDVLVEQGASVREGDLIATLQRAAYEEDLLFAQSELEIAENRLASMESRIAIDRKRAGLQVAVAELDLDFARSRAGSSPTPEQSYEISRLEIQLELAKLELDELNTTIDSSLRTAVDAAKLRVAEAEMALEKTSLVSPIDGMIISLKISPGSVVDAFDPVATVAAVDKLEISALTSASTMEEMEEGMPVTIRFASRPGDEIQGEIRRLPFPFGTGDRADDDASVRIRFEDPVDAQNFDIGDRVSVRILIAERLDVLFLPPAAIREFNGRLFAVVVDKLGTQRRVDIETGIQGRERVEILEGLAEGDIVIGP